MYIIPVYFTRAGRPYVMACDRFADVEGNLRSVTLALDAMRALERHGGGVMLEKAFEGFVALPAPPTPWEVLELVGPRTRDAVTLAYRVKARRLHETGAHESELAALNVARDDARKAIDEGRA